MKNKTLDYNRKVAEEPISLYGSVDLQLSIPKCDIGLFRDLAAKFGWGYKENCSSTKYSSRKMTKSEIQFLDDLKLAAKEAILISEGKAEGQPIDELLKSL